MEDGLVLDVEAPDGTKRAVFILVVVEDGLVPSDSWRNKSNNQVLILVVVEDGLVLDGGAALNEGDMS